jgi:hypothetical protein
MTLEEREKTGREWRKGRRRRRHEEGGLRSDKNRGGKEGGRRPRRKRTKVIGREGKWVRVELARAQQRQGLLRFYNLHPSQTTNWSSPTHEPPL